MPGPPPKDPALRQRRNKVATRATLTSTPARGRGAAPKLPPRPAGARPWHPMTRAFWRDVWASPMSAKYLTADAHGLFVLAELVDRFWHDPTPEAAREIRLHRKDYGVTPLDRWRLQWSLHETPVDPPAAAPAPVAAPVPMPAAGGAEDPRRLLAMVKR